MRRDGLLIFSLSFCLTEVGLGSGKGVIPCFCLHYQASRGYYVLPIHFLVSPQKQYFPRTAMLILVLYTLRILPFDSPGASTLILCVSYLFSVFPHSRVRPSSWSRFHLYFTTTKSTLYPALTIFFSFLRSLCLTSLQCKLQSWLCKLQLFHYLHIYWNLQSTL